MASHGDTHSMTKEYSNITARHTLNMVWKVKSLSQNRSNELPRQRQFSHFWFIPHYVLGKTKFHKQSCYIFPPILSIVGSWKYLLYLKEENHYLFQSGRKYNKEAYSNIRLQTIIIPWGIEPLESLEAAITAIHSFQLLLPDIVLSAAYNIYHNSMPQWYLSDA